jgi:uncharacterized membrane protein YphA (DoxX/SURF4 family)
MRLLGRVIMSLVTQTPFLVAAILHWPGTWIAARIALTSAYVLGGLTKLLNFSGAIAEQEAFGLRPGKLWACISILIEFGGSALVISGYFVWVGAGALGVLTAIAMLLADRFWTLQGQARFAAANTFFEHLGLIAGLALAAILAG